MTDAPANVRLLQTERDKQSQSCAEEFIELAKQVVEHRKGDIAGFAIVMWGVNNVPTAITRVWDMGRLPRQLVPEFVAQVVREDITMRNVLNALASVEEDDGNGGAA
jgi:hypothetical protein